MKQQVTMVPVEGMQEWVEANGGSYYDGRADTTVHWYDPVKQMKYSAPLSAVTISPMLRIDIKITLPDDETLMLFKLKYGPEVQQ